LYAHFETQCLMKPVAFAIFNLHPPAFWESSQSL
jgi:hypothetical protein